MREAELGKIPALSGDYKLLLRVLTPLQPTLCDTKLKVAKIQNMFAAAAPLSKP